MAYNVNDNTTLKHLLMLAERTKTDYEKLIGAVSAEVAKAFKSAKVEGNKVNLYTSPDQTGEVAFSFDFPKEQFLDQTKTTFVPKFAFSAETYPGATDPNLEGKPVMVLAVKGEEGETETVAYSFLDMATLLDTYAAGDGDGSTTVTVDGYKISVNVNISEKEGNMLRKDENGKLFVPETDTSGKADKVTDAVAGNIATFDENGNPMDSGITFATDEAVKEGLDGIFGEESAE